MKTRFLMFAAMASAVVLAGCSSVDLDETAKVGTVQTVVTPGAEGLRILNSQPDRSVYFEFNSYTVDAKYNKTLEKHARTMNSNPTVNVVIEGNTDSRGSREYNLALGQKRSEAVKKRLQLLGVSPRRIEAVSFGREKPVATEETEAAWAQNRRADIVYQ